MAVGVYRNRRPTSQYRRRKVGLVPAAAVVPPILAPSEWWAPPKRWVAPPGFDPTFERPFGTLVPTAKPSEPWFDPPKRWVAPPGFEPTWTRNYGIPVPTTKLPEPWFDPPKRWVAPPGFDPTFERPFGTQVPTTKPPEPWFDPPKRWVAPPGFEPTWTKSPVTPATTPITDGLEPWSDPPKRRAPTQAFEPYPIPPPLPSVGAVRFIADGGYNSAVTNSVFLTTPAGINPGNILVAFVAIQDSTGGTLPTISTLAGWTRIVDSPYCPLQGGARSRVSVFWKNVIPGEASGFTFTGVANGGTIAGMDGNIRAYAGASGINGIGANAPAVLNGPVTVTISDSFGYQSNEKAVYCLLDQGNYVDDTASPVKLTDVFINPGGFEAWVIGDFDTTGSSPAPEILGSASNDSITAVGFTLIPSPAPQPSWWSSDQLKPVRGPFSWDQLPLRPLVAIPPPPLPEPFWDYPKKRIDVRLTDLDLGWLRNQGINVPQVLLPEPFWLNASRRYPIPGFSTDAFAPATVTFSSDAWWSPYRQTIKPQIWDNIPQPFGTTVPTSKPSEPWFDPPKRWVAPPGFEAPPWRNLGIQVPTAALPAEWWSVRQPSRQTIWNIDVLQPFAAAAVQPPFAPNDWWSLARRSYSTLSWDGNIVPLAVLAPSVPQEWWTTYRQLYRAPVWDSSAPQPYGVPVPTSKPSEAWFDPPKRWVAPPGFEAPPWRNLGTTVPTTLPPPVWFEPPQRWVAKQWFEVTWFQNLGVLVPTTKPSEPWFDPPVRWRAGPGFEPHPLKFIVPGTLTPSLALPTPWFDPPQRWSPRQWFEPTWFQNRGILVPTFKLPEPWFDPPKRWVAPPGFEPTWVRPFGTQVPTSVLPPEWWLALRRALPVLTWPSDVLRPIVTPSLVSVEWWLAKRQALGIGWDVSSPLLPTAFPPFPASDWWQGVVRRRQRVEWLDVLRPISAAVIAPPPFIGSEWWRSSLSAARAEWWQLIPLGTPLVPFMDQGWWGLTAQGAAREWWRDTSISPPTGFIGGWQAGFFDPKWSIRLSTQDWAPGPFFALNFIAPQQIVFGPIEPLIVRDDKPVSDIVYAIDIVNIVKK